MITKMGSKALELSDTQQNAMAAGGIAGGGAVVGRQFRDGNITGRETLYHGAADAKAKRSILRKGLKRTTDANAINTKVLKGDPNVYRKALGKVYLTRSAFEAGGYSEGARARRAGVGARADNIIRNYLKRDTIVKANVPLWKMPTVRNPETEMGFKAWKAKVAPFAPDWAVRGSYDAMDKAVVIPKDLAPEYLKGSSKYKGLGGRELISYLKNNKVRALKGLGIAGAGLATAGLGVRNLTKRYFGAKTEDNLS